MITVPWAFSLCLNSEEQGRNLRGRDAWQLLLSQHRIDVPVQSPLVAMPRVFTHGNGLGGHEHRLTELLQRHYPGGLLCLLRFALPLLRAADNLAAVTLTLKFRGDGGKLPLDGALAPAFGRIPAFGQLPLRPSAADGDLIERLAVLGRQ